PASEAGCGPAFTDAPARAFRNRPRGGRDLLPFRHDFCEAAADASWARLQAAASAHNLVPASVDIVTGTRLERNRKSFASLRARTTSGRSCFAVAAGTAISRVVCRVDSPVMLFMEPETCAACVPGRTEPLRTLT